MSSTKIQGKELIIRQAGPEDSLDAKRLQESYTEGGRVSTQISIKVEDANRALDISHPGNYRLLAYLPGVDMPVGTVAGWPHSVQLGSDKELHQAVLAHRMAVHPDYRRQGIAKALWAELDSWIKSTFDPQEVLVYGYYQSGNQASQNLFKNSGGTFTDFQLVNAPLKTLTPSLEVARTSSYVISELDSSQPGQLATVISNLNEFYKEFSLYKPHTIETFKDWLSLKEIGGITFKLARYYIATGPNGEIVAGMGIFDLNQLFDVRVVDAPAAIQLLNKVLKIYPKDGSLKTGQVNRVWYKPGHLEAGKLIWKEVRQREKKFSNNLLISYDLASSKLQALFKLSKLQPTTKNNLVLLSAPKDITISKPIT
jgi:GNAT superfamily N-acetyltransferase